MSPPRLTSTPTFEPLGAIRAHQSAAWAFAVAPRSSWTSPRDLQVRPRSRMSVQSGIRSTRFGGCGGQHDVVEVPVVAGSGEGCAECRRHVAVAHRRGFQRRADQRREERADGDRIAGAGVHPIAKLGRVEPAAGPLNRVETGDHQRAGRCERPWVGHHDACEGAPDRPLRARRRWPDSVDVIGIAITTRPSAPGGLDRCRPTKPPPLSSVPLLRSPPLVEVVPVTPPVPVFEAEVADDAYAAPASATEPATAAMASPAVLVRILRSPESRTSRLLAMQSSVRRLPGRTVGSRCELPVSVAETVQDVMISSWPDSMPQRDSSRGTAGSSSATTAASTSSKPAGRSRRAALVGSAERRPRVR